MRASFDRSIILFFRAETPPNLGESFGPPVQAKNHDVIRHNIIIGVCKDNSDNVAINRAYGSDVIILSRYFCKLGAGHLSRTEDLFSSTFGISLSFLWRALPPDSTEAT